MDNKTNAVEKDKATESTFGSDIKVKITYPDNVPENTKQEKINRIYDILSKHSKVS